MNVTLIDPELAELLSDEPELLALSLIVREVLQADPSVALPPPAPKKRRRLALVL